MKILHYSLGLPPYRSGGLTRYSLDLMKAEHELGHTIFLLYPGQQKLISKSIRIIKIKAEPSIQVFELINPLPVPLLGGIKHPEDFQKRADIQVFREFLSWLQPDIIHLHTLMGLYQEFLEAARELGIKTVFTTHDYFGLCPRVNLFDQAYRNCNDYQDGVKCSSCNSGGYSRTKIFIMQSRLYRRYKSSKVLSLLRQSEKHRQKRAGQNPAGESAAAGNPSEYAALRQYYVQMFQMIDAFHFNSRVCQEQYLKQLSLNGEVIPITHGGILDNRVIKEFAHSKLRITYLGPLEIYKGYELLHTSLNLLSAQGIDNWHLDVHGNEGLSETQRITCHGRYDETDLQSIFAHTDVLVMPSICYETFGFVGLEALSHGVPVIVTENTGFRDIIKDRETGFIIRADSDELSELLQCVIGDRSILASINQNIVNMDFSYSLEFHARRILDFYHKDFSRYE